MRTSAISGAAPDGLPQEGPQKVIPSSFILAAACRGVEDALETLHMTSRRSLSRSRQRGCVELLLTPRRKSQRCKPEGTLVREIVGDAIVEECLWAVLIS